MKLGPEINYTRKEENVMKIIEVKCPSCGGKLKVEDSQTKLITCEFCGSQFLLDDEKVQNITNYNIYQTTPPRKELSGGRAAAMAGVGIIAMVLLALAVSSASDTSTRATPAPAVPAYGYGAREPGRGADGITGADGADGAGDVREGEGKPKAHPGSELYKAMVSRIFGKPLSQVDESDLARIKYLEVFTSLETEQVKYSFDDPYGEGEPLIQRASFEGMEWTPQDAAAFTGLVKLDLGYNFTEDMDLSGLTALKGITADGMEIRAIADMVADPARITELDLKNITSLDGISSFGNLERLSICDVPASNLKQLVPLKKLKSLELTDTGSSGSMIDTGEDETRVTDYSAISVMTSLESLSLKSDIIRDMGFIKDLPALTSLTLNGTSVMSLEPLAQMAGLRSLSLLKNGRVQDYTPVGMVTGLTELTIDKLTSSTDPDLWALTQLEKLDISGFMSTSSLNGLAGLRELSIHSCNLDGAEALSSLSGVERLTMYSVWNSAGALRSLDFLQGMTNLKYADFNGNLDGTGWVGYQYFMEVYGDVSSVFNHEGLEELYLDNGRFEIDFDKIRENPTLRVLGLRDLELHKNYYVETYGGLTSVWYDDVKLREHMDVLSRFPNLEELYLDSNELTDVAFAAGLKNLSRLSLKDNYITDLSPLVRAEKLTWLNLTDNPVGDMNDGVEIVQ